MRFTIEGIPRTKKTSQRIMRGAGGRPFVMQSAAAVSWEKMAVAQLRRQLGRDAVELPPYYRTAVNLRAIVYRERAVGDLGNYLAAVCDALEAAGVVANDRLILGFDGSRLRKDAARPRVELELTPLAD